MKLGFQYTKYSYERTGTRITAMTDCLLVLVVCMGIRHTKKKIVPDSNPISVSMSMSVDEDRWKIKNEREP